MEDEVGHLGNDLGIDNESSSSISSDGEESNSAKEDTSHCSATKKPDRFKKRTYQSTSMQDFFAKKPKPSSSSLLPVIVVNDEETSHSVSPATKIWIDPCKTETSKLLEEKNM